MSAHARGRALKKAARPVQFHDDAPRSGYREYSSQGASPVLRTGFNVTAYTHEAPAPVTVDAEAIRDTANSETVTGPALAKLRRDLGFLQRLDASAYTETRTMYSSWTVNEARITAFIATWMWERLGWSHSVQRVRDALPGAPATTELMPPNRARNPRYLANRVREVYVDRLLPTVGTLWTIAAGERVTAGHMARMAIQEGSLLAGYQALLPRLEPIPEAHRVVGEIIARRTNAVEFFTEEALARIHRSRGERLAAAVVLAVGGDPLRPAGSRLPGEDPARRSIFSQPEDRAARRAAHEAITAHLPQIPLLNHQNLPSERRS